LENSAVLDEARSAGARSARARHSERFANDLLRVSTRCWFLVVFVGQLLFATYIVLNYILAAVRGHLGDRSTYFAHGYIVGDHLGNGAAAAHIILAALIVSSGALQLLPQVRTRFPSFHRWNGRVYLVSACAASIAGFYIVWFRGGIGDMSQHLGSSLNAALVLVFAAFAVRFAIARDIPKHRRWALRLFMVVSGVWFFRLGFMLWVIINRGPAGFDGATFTGPFLTIWGFGSFLAPLVILEVYLRVQKQVGVAPRIGMAISIFALSIAMVAGLLGTVMVMWLPAIKSA
jgi:uncharacterized membrane protein